MACAVSVTVLPLAKRSTAVSCYGVSVQSGVSGFIGLCRDIALSSLWCQSALLSTRMCGGLPCADGRMSAQRIAHHRDCRCACQLSFPLLLRTLAGGFP